MKFLPSLTILATLLTHLSSACLSTAITNFEDAGGLVATITKDRNQLQCYLARYTNQTFIHDGLFYDLDLTCLHPSVNATLQVPVARGGPDQYSVRFKEVGEESVFVTALVLETALWKVENGTAYRRYYGEAGC